MLTIPHSPENASVFRGFFIATISARTTSVHYHNSMTEEFLKKFDQAIENKSEIEFFKLATKICRKYAYYYSHLSKNITEDWELTADESVLKILELVKKTDWKHTPNYYFGCLKNEVKWQHLRYLKEHCQEYSLEQVTTDANGECFADSIALVPVKEERTYNQEIELKAAQNELVRTDSLLKIANQKLISIQTKVESDKASLKATPEELTLLTRTRIWRDSIRTQFETLGAKIHYIRQKQKEAESEE